LLRARGNKGELAAVPFTSRHEGFKSVIVNQVPMEVEHSWMHGDHVIFKFKGVDTISDAEKLRGAEVLIPIGERAEIPEGEYYQSDLVGCEVIGHDGQPLGVVEGWQETGGTPLVEVKKTDGKELLIPFAKSIFTKIDLNQRRIEVNLPEGLLDL
jgi:16S rRNA processing protein RimM